MQYFALVVLMLIYVNAFLHMDIPHLRGKSLQHPGHFETNLYVFHI